MAPGGNPKKRKLQYAKNHTSISTPRRSSRIDGLIDGLTDSSPNLVVQSQTHVPQTGSNGHQTQSSGLQTQATGLQSQSNVPRTVSSVRQTESTTIQTQTSVPETQSDVPQSDVPQSDPVPSIQKRRRGPTMGRGLMKEIGKSSGKKMKIDVDPLIGRPKNRVESAKFSSQIGVVTRDVLPVPKKWKDVDVKTALAPCIDHMQIHLDVNVEKPGVKECLKDRIQASSRQRRYRLHAHFKQFANLEEAKNNVPQGCAKENWESLCLYFDSPEYKNRSQVNTKNRLKVRNGHITGRTSFSVIQNELGKDNNEIALYKVTHVEKNENSDLMMKKKEKYAEDGIEKTEQEIATEVLGPACGYIKGRGYGPKPPGKRGMSSTRIEQELELAREELEKSKSLAAGHQNVVDELRNKLSEQGKMIDKITAFMEASQKKDAEKNDASRNHEEDESESE